MIQLALARAQLSIVLCAVNVVLAVTFVRLADEVRLVVSTTRGMGHVRDRCLPM